MLRTLVVASLALAAPLAAQIPADRAVQVQLTGEAGDILRNVLAGPHIVIEAPPDGVELPRDSVYGTSVVVLRGPAYVSSTVQGDVVVVGADLFMRPGGEIAGRAVAIGGSTHHSTMARAAGGLWSFRFLRIDVRDTPAGYEVALAAAPRDREPVLSLPGVSGLRIPAYNRVDGVALPWGPEARLAGGRVRITPLVTYRTELGAFDGSGHVLIEPSQRVFIDLFAGRGTFTNDDWIQTDFGNSITTLLRGRDYRNYFRTERFEGRVLPRFTAGEVALTLGAGARTERSWSVEAGGPWSITGRESTRGTERPNPEILPGRITSALGSADAAWDGIGGVSVRALAEVEVAIDAPEDGRFVQTMFDGSVTFPTFGFQSLTIRARALLTTGDDAPPQRFAYLGGAGTLPTLPILSMGGDRLLFVESSYNVPIDAIVLGLLGSPVVSLRHMLGSAGEGRLPSLEQNIGLRLTLGFFRADAVLEPVDGDTRFDLGLVFIR